VVALAFLFAGLFAVICGSGEGLRQFHEGRATPLEVVYDPADPLCQQIREREGDTQLRVRVRNVGRFGLKQVRARLTLEGGYGHWLRLEHDNASPYPRSVIEGEVLPALGSYAIYFDVVFLGRQGQIALEYADDYLRGSSVELLRGGGTHPVTVQVWGARESDGRTVPPAERRFNLLVIPSEIGEALEMPHLGRDISLEPLDDT
jgi:hypothetical protein